MRALGISVLAVAALIGLPSAGAAASGPAAHKVTPAWFTANDEGSGATETAAEQDALHNLVGDFGPCRAPYTYYDQTQKPNGTWTSWVSATCENHN